MIAWHTRERSAGRSPASPDKLGELLLKSGKITPDSAQRGPRAPEGAGRPDRHQPGQAGLPDRQAARRRRSSQQFGVPSIDLDGMEIDEAVIKIIPADVARKYTILPVSKTGATVTDRDDRSDQRLRDGRHQVHDRLQRRAGGGVGVGDPGGDRQATTARPTRSSSRRSWRTSPSESGDADLEVLEEEEGPRPRGARGGVRRGAGRQAGEPDAHRRHQARRLRHPHRALREGVPRPLPHRRHALRDDAPAAQAARRRSPAACKIMAQARHRREAPAAGRPHQDQDQARRTRSRSSTSASRCCPRSSARRSSCACSTRTT